MTTPVQIQDTLPNSIARTEAGYEVRCGRGHTIVTEAIFADAQKQFGHTSCHRCYARRQVEAHARSLRKRAKLAPTVAVGRRYTVAAEKIEARLEMMPR